MRTALTFLSIALFALPNVASAQLWTSWSQATGCSGPVTGTLGSTTVTYNGPFNGVMEDDLDICLGPLARKDQTAHSIVWGDDRSIDWFNDPAFGLNGPGGSYIQQVYWMNYDGTTWVDYTGWGTVTFSEAVINPWFAILSAGNYDHSLLTGNPVTYEFDAPFSVASWNNSTPTVFGLGDQSTFSSYLLTGYEFSGILQFTGTFTSLNFRISGAENFHGFTIGAARVPEPATLGLVGLGLAGLAGFTGLARRRRG